MDLNARNMKDMMDVIGCVRHAAALKGTKGQAAAVAKLLPDYMIAAICSEEFGKWFQELYREIESKARF